MGSIDSLYDKVKRYVLGFTSGKGTSSSVTGYMTGELQTVVFIMVIAAFFRIFSIPLGMVVLIAVVTALLYFGPRSRRWNRRTVAT